MHDWSIAGGALSIAGRELMVGLGHELHVERATPSGAVIGATLETLEARQVLALGTISGMRRSLGCHRHDPFWMRPHLATDPTGIPTGTTYELIELHDARFLLLVPLIDATYHSCLRGSPAGLELVLDSGHGHCARRSATPLFVALGDDPHELIARAARDVSALLQSTPLQCGKLRGDKRPPRFIDAFGWCTWDAFYREVSAEGVLRGLHSLRDAGVSPLFVILDDGWQSVTSRGHGGRLRALTATDAFDCDLSVMIQSAKQQCGVETFLVWHAVHGYWSGVDPEALPDYEAHVIARHYAPEALAHAPRTNAELGGAHGCPPSPDALGRFYRDYHALLASCGVDGVKVDNQASVEGFAHAQSGRVNTWAGMRAALENSVEEHFDGQVLHCMSSSSEGYYLARDTTLTRTSTDYWPYDPASHGAHLFTNALVSLWFGEFVQPDWDMFQSKHTAGAYHAAARALSGGPVYVSDVPGDHDSELLRKLVHSDGSIPRCLGVAKPTRRSLFGDPTVEAVPLQLYNHNRASAVLGLFDARSNDHGAPLRCEASPADVPLECWRDVFAGGHDFEPVELTYAVFLGQAQTLHELAWTDTLRLELGWLEYELATLAPIIGGLAPIGLLDKLNPGGTLSAITRRADGLEVVLRDGGRFGCFSRRVPTRILLDDAEVLRFSYDAATRLLVVELPEAARHRLLVCG